MRDKKGLSTVVTTLIIILLVLVAIGIVWVVIRGVIETGSGQIDAKSNCIGVELSIEAASCDGVGTCNIDIQRRPGGSTITGIVVTATNADGTGRAEFDSVTIPPGDLLELAQDTFPVAIAGTATVVDSATTAAMVDDGTGNNVVCDLVSEYP